MSISAACILMNQLFRLQVIVHSGSKFCFVPPSQRNMLNKNGSTLIHEATHFRDVLGTVDNGYGVEACKKFALEDPEKAVSTAE